ncbi:MAG: HpcH/HpaI aldolase family protein [Dehalococcoidia bacterium]
MRKNAALEKWRAGEPAYGAWLSVPSSLVAEAIAKQRYDYVTIDMQHGAIDYQEAVHMLQAISTSDATPIVRVPWNDFGIIGKVLDAGAMGVVIPMVNSVEEARLAVSACRYFPDGARSFGPVRAGLYAGPDYYAHANEEVACIPMIETRQAYQAIDGILSVPGITAVYVGPADMSITLGLPPRMDNGGEFEEIRLGVVEACARHGVFPGIHANASLAAKHAAAGYKMITISSDMGLLGAGAAADLRLARGEQPVESRR